MLRPLYLTVTVRGACKVPGLLLSATAARVVFVRAPVGRAHGRPVPLRPRRVQRRDAGQALSLGPDVAVTVPRRPGVLRVRVTRATAHVMAGHRRPSPLAG